MHPYFLNGDGSPFVAGLKWTSPIISYLVAIGWGVPHDKEHVPALLILLFAAAALDPFGAGTVPEAPLRGSRAGHGL